jgi:hypothetical protein
VTEVPDAAPAYRRAPDVAEVVDDGRVVLLHLPSGRRSVLSDTAGAVWRAVGAAGAAGARAVDVSPDLAAEYAEDPARIAADVARLLQQLRDAGLVTVLPGHP